MSAAYSYETLPSGYIRYLLLQPGESGDPITCSLHVTKLEDPTPYEGISYVWGTPDQTEPIECDGKTLYITVNLRDALVAVRRLDEARALWSDSICINQADNAEKADQVALMADIYRKSTGTLICLGSSDGGQHSEAAAEIITTVNHMMDNVFRVKDFSWEPSSFPYLPADDPLLSDPRWESVATLTGQLWFKRCWVVQEAALSPVAEIIWSGVRIDWLQFLRAYVWILRRATTVFMKLFLTRSITNLHLTLFRMRLPHEYTALAFYPLPLTLLDVLDHGRILGATDPRDRIYACLSLPHSTTSLAPQITDLKPDYDKEHEQVYHDFACTYLEMSGMDLDLLGYAQNFGHTDPESDCPSWVPLWNVRSYSAAIYSSHSRRHSSQFPDLMPSLPCLVDRNTLKVRGLLIGSVQYVTDNFYSDTAFETFGSIWREVEYLGTSSQLDSNPYHSSSRQAFVETLAAGNFIGDTDEWISREVPYMDYIQRKTSQEVAGADSKTFSSGRSEEDTEDIVASMTEMHAAIMDTARHRKLVVSDRGYYGLAPAPAEKGDIICIVFGAKAPFLLRRASAASPEGVEQYKLVGDMFMLSAKGAENGDRLMPLGCEEACDDWRDWGLEEQDILMC